MEGLGWRRPTCQRHCPLPRPARTPSSCCSARRPSAASSLSLRTRWRRRWTGCAPGRRLSSTAGEGLRAGPGRGTCDLGGPDSVPKPSMLGDLKGRGHAGRGDRWRCHLGLLGAVPVGWAPQLSRAQFRRGAHAPCSAVCSGEQRDAPRLLAQPSGVVEHVLVRSWDECLHSLSRVWSI